MKKHTHKVGLVGTGNVGIAGAYAMVCQNICPELILVDLDRQRAEAEAMDLMHGQGYLGRLTVRAGDYADLSECQVVIVTAGAAQRPGETRLDLLQKNARIFEKIAAELDRHAPTARLIIATNPVDILTYLMQEMSDRPRHHIIGTGTMLDTSRFRSLLGAHYGVDPRSVHGYILGEHGDSEFPAWSTLTLGGETPVDRVILGRTWDSTAMDALFVEVRDAAYRIIEGKGYTNLAIGLVIARLTQIILDDLRSVQPVSVRLEGDYGLQDVALSVPAVIGANGREGIVHLDLPEEEQNALQASGKILRENLSQIGF